MGGGIAQALTGSGRHVSLRAPPGSVELGRPRWEESERLAAQGVEIDPDDVLGRVTPVDGIVPVDLMIEAVVDDQAVKEAIFREADSELSAEAILASNTSSIPIASLAAPTSRPDKVIGMHFFNPVPVMALVEVVSTKETSSETRAAAVSSRGPRQDPRRGQRLPGLRLESDPSPFINQAVWALHDGVAEPEAIDTIAKLGFNHPMGPLALADLIGLDTCVAILEVLREGLRDERYEPCPLLREHVAAGRLGRRSGAGFYSYESP